MPFSERQKTQLAPELGVRLRVVRELTAEYPNVDVEDAIGLAPTHTRTDRNKRPRATDTRPPVDASEAVFGSKTASGAAAGTVQPALSVGPADGSSATKLALEVSRLEKRLADARELVQQLSSSGKYVSPEVIKTVVREANSLKEQLDAAKQAARRHNDVLQAAAAAQAPTKRRRTGSGGSRTALGASTLVVSGDDAATQSHGGDVLEEVVALLEYVPVACSAQLCLCATATGSWLLLAVATPLLPTGYSQRNLKRWRAPYLQSRLTSGGPNGNVGPRKLGPAPT